MKVVLDTNVIVSALLNPNGRPAQLLNLILNGTAVWVYDDRILAEYQNVLNRKKFNFNHELIRVLLRFVMYKGQFIQAIPTSVNFNDDEDKKFYEVFKSDNVQFLITGNKRHFPKEWNIVSPKEFMDIIKL